MRHTTLHQPPEIRLSLCSGKVQTTVIHLIDHMQPAPGEGDEGPGGGGQLLRGPGGHLQAPPQGWGHGAGTGQVTNSQAVQTIRSNSLSSLRAPIWLVCPYTNYPEPLPHLGTGRGSRCGGGRPPGARGTPSLLTWAQGHSRTGHRAASMAGTC